MSSCEGCGKPPAVACFSHGGADLCVNCVLTDAKHSHVRALSLSAWLLHVALGGASLLLALTS
jgi:hypothetical protein